MPDYNDVLDFWFHETEPKQWFVKSDAFDTRVRERLLPLHLRAAGNKLDHWAAESQPLIALCILLDQVPRNLFRGQARAFATDAKILSIVKTALDQGLDEGLTTDEKLFIYLPLEHSEVLEDQVRSVELLSDLGSEQLAHYAIAHYDIINRFGRFPHRNEALGRTSTAEELEFLAQPGSSF